MGKGLWKIKDTPRWSAEDLVKWLLKLGWKGVEVVAPPSEKKKLGWLVRGDPGQQGDAWCVSIPNTQRKVMVLRHVSKPSGYSIQPMKKASLSWTFPPGKPADEAKPSLLEGTGSEPKIEEVKEEETKTEKREGSEERDWLATAAAEDGPTEALDVDEEAGEGARASKR
eukprot:12460848-Alexandrium_andersonii.AAC.1